MSLSIADRSRTYRRRRKRGLVRLPVDVSHEQIDQLQGLGYLDAKERGDTAERTYASWVRTGLFSLASGMGARALLTGVLPEWLILSDATMLVMFSAFCFAAAIWRHLNPGPPPPVPNVRRIPGALLIVANAFLALVSIAALIGIWMAPR